MSKAFIFGVETRFPKAQLTFDKFHVMKIVNDGVNAVRKSGMVKNAVLKKTKYVWLKNPKNLTKKHLSTLGSLSNENLKTKRKPSQHKMREYLSNSHLSESD